MVKRCSCSEIFSTSRNRKTCFKCTGDKYKVCEICGAIHQDRRCGECSGIPKRFALAISNSKDPMSVRVSILSINSEFKVCQICGDEECRCQSLYKDSMSKIENLVGVNIQRFGGRKKGTPESTLDMMRFGQVASQVLRMSRGGWYADPHIPSLYMAAGLYEFASMPWPEMRKIYLKHSALMIGCLDLAYGIALRNQKREKA